MSARAIAAFAGVLVMLVAPPSLACTMMFVENTMLAWTSDDGTLSFDSYERLYRLDRESRAVEPIRFESARDAPISSFHISPDRTSVAVATASHDASCRGLEPRLRIIDLASRKTIASANRRTGYFGVLGWAADSRSLVIGFSDRHGPEIDSPQVREVNHVDLGLNPIAKFPVEAFGLLRPDLRMALDYERSDLLTAHWLGEPPRSRGIVAVDVDPQTIRFSGDGRLVAYGLPRSKIGSTVVIRDAESLEPITKLDVLGQRVLSLAFHPTRTFVAVASEELPDPHHSDRLPDTRIDLMDYAAGETLGRTRIAGYRASRLEWSYDGRTLAVGGSLDDSSKPPRPWLIELDQML